jgi:[ribosomal protein S18]-alanine N-acetyltransferase
MPIPGLTLRPYQPSDFNALVAMDQVCFPKTIAYGRREMQGYLHSENSHCIVAEISGLITGFILIESKGDLAHVITLDVAPAHRRKSAGSLLLAAAEDEAVSRGAARMVLETATSNEPAIALWNKHGYRVTGTIVNYYGRGQNAFEMQKRLERKSSLSKKGKALP